MHQEIEGPETCSQSQEQPCGADCGVEEKPQDRDYAQWGRSKQGEDVR